MGVQVAFNFDQWIQLFPQFNYLNSAQASLYFGLAEQVHRNDGGGPVQDATTQSNLLNLATAHIAQLFAPTPTNPNQPNRDPNVVGRITNASEGSVSVATEMPMPVNANASWWNTTNYGAMYWLASSPFRTMRYIQAPLKPVNPWPIVGSWWGNW